MSRSPIESIIPVGGPRREGRKGRRYLINLRFQLKYTGLLVLVVVSILLSLGLVISSIAATSADNAEYASAQAEKALRESETSSKLVRANSLESAGDNPELVKLIEEEVAKADRELAQNLEQVKVRRQSVVDGRKQLMGSLIGGGVLLVVVLVILGIYLTHRIVGPAYKMKRLLRQVGSGRLDVKQRLRKGDELADLFDTFMQMTYSLKALQLDYVATLDVATEEAEKAGLPAEARERLAALRTQMLMGVGGREPNLGTRASQPPEIAPRKA